MGALLRMRELHGVLPEDAREIHERWARFLAEQNALPSRDECKAYWKARFSEWRGDVLAARALWGLAYR